MVIPVLGFSSRHKQFSLSLAGWLTALFYFRPFDRHWPLVKRAATISKPRMFTRGWLTGLASSPGKRSARAIILDLAAVLISRNVRRHLSHPHGLSLHGGLGLVNGFK